MTSDSFYDPEPAAGSSDAAGTWRSAARLSELRDGSTKLVQIDGRAIGLFRIGDAIYALDNVCPHAGAPLSRGYVAGGVVSCPMHHWRFRLADGARLDGPRRPGVATYRVRVVRDEVQIELPSPETTEPGESA